MSKKTTPSWQGCGRGRGISERSEGIPPAESDRGLPAAITRDTGRGLPAITKNRILPAIKLDISNR